MVRHGIIDLVEPFPVRRLPTLWAWIEQFRSRIADDFYPTDLDGFVVKWLTEYECGTRSWGVLRDGILGGAITTRPTSRTVADFHCVFASDFWGANTVVPALGEACRLIFQDPQVDKLATVAFANNHSLAGMLRQFGVRREGLLHGHTRQGGKPVDLQMLGLQRDRFNVVWSQCQSQQLKFDGEHDVASGHTLVVLSEHRDDEHGDLDGKQHVGVERSDGRSGVVAASADTRAAGDDAGVLQTHHAAIHEPDLVSSASAGAGS